MNTDPEIKQVPKPTGRSYATVEALLRGEGVPEEVQAKVNELGSETRLVHQLSLLRHKAGITQEEMAKRLGVTQSAISKLESGLDEDLRLGDIREYSRASGARLAIVFGKRLTHVEAVKLHAEGIRKHLSALAELAHGDQELDRAIQGFFGEAFFNILHILSKCSNELPMNGNGFEIELRSLDGNPIANIKPKKKSGKTTVITSVPA